MHESQQSWQRLIVIVYFFCLPVWAKSYLAHAVFIADGDTVIVQEADGTEHKVRLVGIDAPEKEQHYGLAAKQHLQRVLGNKVLRVETQQNDVYGRELGTLWLNEDDVNLAQIQAGFAWHYRRFAAQQALARRLSYAAAETAARQAKLGLWQETNPTPPWDFRQQQRTQQAIHKQPWQAHFSWFYRWLPWY